MTSPLSPIKTNEAASATSSVQPETKTGKLNGWQVSVSNTPYHMHKLEEEISGVPSPSIFVPFILIGSYLANVGLSENFDRFKDLMLVSTAFTLVPAMAILFAETHKHFESNHLLRNTKNPEFVDWANKNHILLSKDNLESSNKGFEFGEWYEQI